MKRVKNYLLRYPYFRRLQLNRWFQRNRTDAVIERPPGLPDRHCLIASFPRSGNTWFSNLIADVLLQQQGYSTETKLPIYEREIIPDMDRGDLRWCQYTHLAPRLLAKSHYEAQPWMDRTLFLIRQPADCLISFYHFHFRYKDQLPVVERGLEHFIKEFATECWFNHASSHLQRWHRDPKSTHVVSYESLIDDPESRLRIALNHLGIPSAKAQLEKSVANHTFSQHARFEKRSGNLKFFRRGQKDSARTELPRHLHRWIDRICGGLYRKATRLESRQTEEIRLGMEASECPPIAPRGKDRVTVRLAS